MEIAEIIYQGDLRTLSTHLKSKNQIITDAPSDNQGKGEAFSPTDLLCSALASCARTSMGIAAKNDNIQIENTKVIVSKFMLAEPRRVGKISLIFKLPANNYSSKEKAILENAAKTCPVAKSLNDNLIQEFVFEY